MFFSRARSLIRGSSSGKKVGLLFAANFAYPVDKVNLLAMDKIERPIHHSSALMMQAAS